MKDEKQCYRCKETKPLSEFKPDKRMKDGHHSWCVDCWRAYHRERYQQAKKDPEKLARIRKNSMESARRMRAVDPDRHNGYARKYKHNIEQAAYEALLASQQGLCANPGCSRPARDIDHDHTCCPGKRACGKCIRGILCRPCNFVLGAVEDDVERLRGLAIYLEKTMKNEDEKVCGARCGWEDHKDWRPCILPEGHLGGHRDHVDDPQHVWQNGGVGLKDVLSL